MGFAEEAESLLNKGKEAVGRGRAVVDKKTQIMKLQSVLNHISSEREKGFAALGQAVFFQERDNASFLDVYAEQMGRLFEVEAREASIQEQIQELQVAVDALSQNTSKMNAAANDAAPCPSCGAPTCLGDVFCVSCGAILSGAQEGTRQCMSCGAIYSEEFLFCDLCGSKTEPVSVKSEVPPAPASAEPEASLETEAATIEEENAVEPEAGAIVEQDESKIQANEPAASVVIGPDFEARVLAAVNGEAEGASELAAAAETDSPVADEEQAAPLCRCAACGEHLPEGALFCGYCGSPVSKLCAACGNPLDHGALFCGTCGSRV